MTQIIKRYNTLHVKKISIDGVPIEGGVVIGSGQLVDLQGEAGALVFDDDGDTTMDSATDDQIDIVVAGSLDFQITADTFTALSGSAIETDTIAETTSAAGVTVDGVLLKDGQTDATRLQEELTETGAIGITTGVVYLNHATVAIEATLAAPTQGDELLIVDSSATGTAAHTVTCAAGVTFDGTNDIATFDLLGEALLIHAVSATRWAILSNVGSVGLSSS
jgi:hypothetical protein